MNLNIEHEQLRESPEVLRCIFNGEHHNQRIESHLHSLAASYPTFYESLGSFVNSKDQPHIPTCPASLHHVTFGSCIIAFPFA